VRPHLRSATAQAHASLHEHPAFVALVEGNATVELYRSLLGRLYGIYRPLEVALAGAGHHLPSDLRPAHRSRAALMAQDLVALGLDAGAVARLPTKGDVLPPTSRSEALGALYVVQGSALGGEVIAGSLRRRFAGQCAVFTGFADDRQTWKRCCDALEQGTDLGRLTAGAVTTFGHIADWMAGWSGARTAHD
jgi:heme oxygenase